LTVKRSGDIKTGSDGVMGEGMRWKDESAEDTSPHAGDGPLVLILSKHW
jgi:hypothetical protein